MSGRVVGWAAEQVTGSPISKLVLLKLADNANEEGVCWPSIGLIVEHTELGKRTVQEHLTRLEELGLIRIERRESSGATLPNLYHLAVTPPTRRGKTSTAQGEGAPPAPPMRVALGGGDAAPASPVREKAREGAPAAPPGAAPASHIEEPPIEPSENRHSDARAIIAARWDEVWTAFEAWPVKDRTGWSKTRTRIVAERLAETIPDPDRLIACIEAEGRAIAEANRRRKKTDPLHIVRPHNWLERDWGWERHLPDASNRQASVEMLGVTGAHWRAAIGARFDQFLVEIGGQEKFVAWFGSGQLDLGPPPRVIVPKTFSRDWIAERFSGALERAFGCEVIVEAVGRKAGAA